MRHEQWAVHVVIKCVNLSDFLNFTYIFACWYCDIVSLTFVLLMFFKILFYFSRATVRAVL